MFYSCWFDYYATGEGMTVGLLYCQAKDEGCARTIAIREFGDFFSQGLEIEAGVKSDGFFTQFAPPWVIEKFTKMENGECLAGSALWHGTYHLNLS